MSLFASENYVNLKIKYVCEESVIFMLSWPSFEVIIIRTIESIILFSAHRNPALFLVRHRSKQTHWWRNLCLQINLNIYRYMLLINVGVLILWMTLLIHLVESNLSSIVSRKRIISEGCSGDQSPLFVLISGEYTVLWPR